MKKWLIILLAALCFPRPVAANIPKPQITQLSPITPLKLYFNDDTGFRDAEITPWSLGNHKLGGDYLYLVTSYNTHLCSTPTNPFSLDIDTRIENCKLRQSSLVTPSSPRPNTTTNLWSRDYYGAFSGHFLDTNEGLEIYLINHGELLNNNYFPALSEENCLQAPDIGYGVLPCGVNNINKSYNGFVGMSKFLFNLENYNSETKFTDMGPIVWPANGYVVDGQKATNLGVLHPYSITKDGYMYVFFRDTSKGEIAEGRGAGLKLARAPVTSNGVNPTDFKMYYGGSFTDAALPSGFDMNQIYQFFAKPGGRSSPLFNRENSSGNNPDVYSFSVAKIKGSSYYLGAANDLNAGVTLRLSKDLVNWSDQVIVAGTEFNYFDPVSGGTPNFIREPFMYVLLANQDGDSNVEIDPDNFYLIGTTTSTNPFNPSRDAKIVNKLQLKIDLPATKLGDLDNNGVVNIFDFNLLIAHFKNPYTIMDFNHIIANYGK